MKSKVQRKGIHPKTSCEYLNDSVTGSSLIESFIFTIMQAILMCSPFLQRWILRTGKSLALQLHKCQVERKSNKAGRIICKTWSKSSFYLKSYIWVLRPQNKMVLLFAYMSTASKWGCSYCSYIRVSLPFKSVGSARIIIQKMSLMHAKAVFVWLKRTAKTEIVR